MIIKLNEDLDVVYNRWTGYYNLVDEDNNQYGEDYLTYDQALDNINNFKSRDRSIINVKEVNNNNNYVVYRPYESRGQGYLMFSQGSLTKHVSYEIHETYDNFNDESIKLYSKSDAEKVAKEYNKISRKKNLPHYTNWRAQEKWW